MCAGEINRFTNPSIVKTIAILFTILSVLALLLALASFRGDAARRAYFFERLAWRLADAHCPPATVIVPVKGFDEGLAENLAALAAQDYPDFELIVTMREACDLPAGVLPARARLVVAGAGDGAVAASTSHKIINLLAAVDAARAESAIFAFADSDGRPGKQWLRALASELKDSQVGAASGYRWYVPEPPQGQSSGQQAARGDDASNLRSVWNAAIAGTMGPGDNPFCWGGAMAITRANFEKLQVRRYWLGQVSDDFELARAVHAAGLRIAFAPGAVVPCFDHIRFGEFFSWARRQLILTRVYAPKLWWQALVAHVIYISAILSPLVGAGLGGSYWVPVLILGLGAMKAYRRAELLHTVHPELHPQAIAHAQHVTLATFMWLALLAASAFSSTIVWRGVAYRLRRPV